MNLFQRVSLAKNLDEYELKKGGTVTLVEFVDHPDDSEKGCVLEIVNTLGKTISIITVPFSSAEVLKADEILSVRHTSKAVYQASLRRILM